MYHSQIMRWVLIVSLCALIAPPAFAQEADDEFNEIVRQASDAYKNQEDYELAIELLLQAHRIKPVPRLLLNVGKAYGKMGRCDMANAYLRVVLRDPDAAPADKKMVKKELGKFKKCPEYNPDGAGRITFNSIPVGATVKIDGTRIGSTPVEVIMLEPGVTEVEITKDGYEKIAKSVELESNTDRSFDFELEKTKPKVKPEPEGDGDLVDDPPVEDPLLIEPDEKSELNIPAYALLGVGAVGVGVGSFLNFAVLSPGGSIQKEREALLADAENQDDLQGELDRLTAKRRSRMLVMVSSTTVGVLALAGGATLLVLDRGSDDEKPAAVLAPTFLGDGAGVSVMGRF